MQIIVMWSAATRLLAQTPQHAFRTLIQRMFVLARAFLVRIAVNQPARARQSLWRQERSYHWLMHRKTSLVTTILRKAASVMLHLSSPSEQRYSCWTAPTKSAEASPSDASPRLLSPG